MHAAVPCNFTIGVGGLVGIAVRAGVACCIVGVILGWGFAISRLKSQGGAGAGAVHVNAGVPYEQLPYLPQHNREGAAAGQGLE